MIRTLRMIVRGPTAWVLALGIAVGLTALGKSVHASHAVTAPPGPRFLVAVSGRTGAVDPRTGVRLRLIGVSEQEVSAAGTSARSLEIRLQLGVRITNSGPHDVRYSARDFHIVEASGQAFSPGTGKAVASGLGTGHLAAGRTRSGLVPFAVPGSPGSYYVVWDDGGKLLPPAVLERITVRPARTALHPGNT